MTKAMSIRYTQDSIQPPNVTALTSYHQFVTFERIWDYEKKMAAEFDIFFLSSKKRNFFLTWNFFHLWSQIRLLRYSSRYVPSTILSQCHGLLFQIWIGFKNFFSFWRKIWIFDQFFWCGGRKIHLDGKNWGNFTMRCKMISKIFEACRQHRRSIYVYYRWNLLLMGGFSEAPNQSK